MSLKAIALLSIGLWVGTIAVAGYLFFAGITTPSTDGRIKVYLSAGERDFVLGEMRGMLEGIRDITLSLANGEREKARAIAVANGMASVGGVNLLLMAKLPVSFMSLGKDTHQKFDAIASALANQESPQNIQLRIGTLMNNCVSCHSTYSLMAK